MTRCSSGDVEPREALSIVAQICEALQYAHDAEIVHRDIKPENVLLSTEGRVKIADFGLAKLVREASPDVSLTETAQVMGTYRYMAPEQFEGAANVDHRADIYSLGVVFYELLTGEVPMGRFDVPSKKASVDVRVDEVVLRTLEKEPQRRYQQANDIKTDVEAITSSQTAHTASLRPMAARGLQDKQSNLGSAFWSGAGLFAGGGVLLAIMSSFFHDSGIMIGLLVTAALVAFFVRWVSGAEPSTEGESWTSFSVIVIASLLASGLFLFSAETFLTLIANAVGPKWGGIAVFASIFVLLVAGLLMAPLWQEKVVNRRSNSANVNRRFEWSRIPVLSAAILFITVGLFQVLCGIMTYWESAFWHPHADTQQSFEATYTGVESRLLRQLMGAEAMKTDVQLAVDQEGYDWSPKIFGASRKSWGTAEWAQLFFTFLIGVALLSNGIVWCHPRPFSAAWQLILCVVLSLATGWGLLVFIMVLMLSPQLTASPRLEGELKRTIRCDGSMEDITTAMDNWFRENGYSADEAWGYKFTNVGSGDVEARFRYAELYPESFFDRWQLSVNGLVRSRPLLIVRLLIGSKSNTALVTLDARCGPASLDKDTKWAPLLGSFEEAISASERLKSN